MSDMQPFPTQPVPSAGSAGGPPPAFIPLPARFEFDGGAATYLGTGILAFLITVCTLGIGLPWAIALRYSWRRAVSRIVL